MKIEASIIKVDKRLAKNGCWSQDEIGNVDQGLCE